MQYSLSTLIILGVACCTLPALAQSDMDKLLAKSDPEIQKQIGAVFNTQSEVEAFERMESLRKMAGDNAELVEQLAIYAIAAPNQKEMHVLSTFGVLYRLELQPSISIRVLAPYLRSEHEGLSEFAELWFHNHDSNDRILGKSPLGSVNYHDYMQYVRARLGRNEEIPSGFIEYIYEKHPGKALLVFTNAMGVENALAQIQAIHEAMRQGPHRTPEEIRELREEERQRKIRRDSTNKERRELLLAEHIVSNATWLQENRFEERFQQALPEAQQELKKLAEHDQWWARLYVAEIMNKYPELRDREVVKVLEDDSNDIVVRTARKAAKAIQRIDEAKRAKWLEKHGTATEKLLARKRQPIQEQIRRVYESLRTYPSLDPFSNMEAMQETQELKNIIDNKFEIVSQIAIFAAEPGEAHSHAKTILEMLDLPPQIAVRELAPYLNTDNKNLRSFVRDWFQAHDKARPDISPLDEVNFKEYQVYIRGQLSLKQEVPTGFVEYI